MRMLRLTEEQLTQRKAGKTPLPKKSEHAEQADFFRWWWAYADHKGLHRKLCFAIPNASALSDTGRIFKWAEGLTPGVSDIFLSVPRGHFHGLYIEMKALDGKESDEQAQFANEVYRQGYNAKLAFGALDAIKAAEDYLAL